MFQAPSNTKSYVAPAETIDIAERYIFKLVNLEDRGVSKFADPAKKEDFHNIEWTMHVATADKHVVLNIDGVPWEHVEFTTSKTGKNPKNGMIAKARLFIEAFLGHAMEDDEITADLPSLLIGRYAVGFFEEVERQAQDGSTYNKLRIMRLTPYKAGAKPEPKPAPKPQPVAVAAPAGDEPPF